MLPAAAPVPDAVMPAVAALRPIVAMTARHFADDLQRVAMPQVEAQLVARFGPSFPGGVDLHAMGPRTQVHRKFIRGGQRAVLARLQPGMYPAALGVSAAELKGAPVPLEDLWGHARVQRLREQLATAPDAPAAGVWLARAVSERVARTGGVGAMPSFLYAALAQLPGSSVGAVARALGVSERHLRRVLQEALGLSPKTYSRLKRFGQAVRAAQAGGEVNWSAIAADAGYYDQAHLIAEFQAIGGSTPRGLLAELQEGAIAPLS